MNNEYLGTDGQRHSVPPTLVITAVAHVPDADAVVTPDLKRAGDALVLVGNTAAEFGGSHLGALLGGFDDRARRQRARSRPGGACAIPPPARGAAHRPHPRLPRRQRGWPGRGAGRDGARRRAGRRRAAAAAQRSDRVAVRREHRPLRVRGRRRRRRLAGRRARRARGAAGRGDRRADHRSAARPRHAGRCRRRVPRRGRARERHPTALVLNAPGTNRDHDVAFALQLAGADADRSSSLHELAERPQLLARRADAGGRRRVQPCRRAGCRAHVRGVAAAGGRRRPARRSSPPASRSSASATGSRRWSAPGCCRARSATTPAAASSASGSRCSRRPATASGPRDIDAFDCPIAHGEGRYVHPDVDALERGGQVALRYAVEPQRQHGVDRRRVRPHAAWCWG